MQTSQETPHQADAKPKVSTSVQMIVLSLIFSCLVSFIFLFNPTASKPLFESLSLLFTGQTTTGLVIEEKAIPSGHPSLGKVNYQLTIAFEANGQPHNFKSQMYYEARENGWLNEPLKVIYNPKDPSIAFINSFNERWMTPLTKALP